METENSAPGALVSDVDVGCGGQIKLQAQALAKKRIESEMDVAEEADGESGITKIQYFPGCRR